MRGFIVASALALATALIAFGALASSSSGCAQYGQYGQYGGAGGAQYGQYQYGQCCPGGGQYGGQYGQYGGAGGVQYGSGGSQYGQYTGCCPGSGGSQYGQYGGAGGSQYGSGGSQYGQYGGCGSGTGQQVFAGDNVYESANASGDSVDASTAIPGGWIAWNVDLLNELDTALPSASIDIPSSLLTFPGVTFPDTTTSNGTFAPHSALTLTNLFKSNWDVTTGFDLTRTQSVSTIPAGGASVQVQVSITPRRSADSFNLQLSPNQFVGQAGLAAIETTSVSLPSLGAGETLGYHSVTANGINVSVNTPVFGKTYTVTATIDVANPTGQPFPYKAGVFGGITSGPVFPEQTTSSVSIADPILGSTITYSVGQIVRIASSLTHNVDVTLPGIAPPSYTVSLDRPTVSVHAGSSFTENATVTPLGPFTGQVGFLNLINPPSGVFPIRPWDPVTVGPGPATRALPIQTQASTPPGTYQLQIQTLTQFGGGSTYTPFQLTVLPALPQAHAQATRIQSLDLGSGVDSVTGSASLIGSRGFRGQIDNWNFNTGAVLGSPEIGLDEADPSWAFTPAVSFPLHQGPGADIPVGQQYQLNDVAECCGPSGPTSAVHNVPVTTGYDAGRTFDTTTIPVGGGDELVTTTMTLRDARYAHGWTQIDVWANWYGGNAASFVTSSIQSSVLSHGEFGTPFVSPQNISWPINNAAVNVPYTLTVRIHVANGGAGPAHYKPMVILHAGWSTSLPADDGTAATTIGDPVLGGTWSFRVGGTVSWTRDLADVIETNLEAQQLTPYDVAVDHPDLTVHAGGQVTQSGTVTPATFTGNINFFLWGPDQSTAPPNGINPWNPWPQNTPLGTSPYSFGPLQIHVDPSVAPGDYPLTIGVWANGVPTEYAHFTLHVLAAVPQAFVRSDRRAAVETSGNSLSAGVSHPDGYLGWAADFTNQDQAATLVNARIQASGTTQPFSPAPGSFPKTAGPRDLGPNTGLSWSDLDGYFGRPRVPNRSVTTRTDVTRSVSPATLPAAGGVEHVTVTVTTHDPGDQSLDLFVSPDTFGNRSSGASFVAGSVLWPLLAGSEFQYSQTTSANFIHWGVYNIVPGRTYTLQFDVSVPPLASASFTYAPQVESRTNALSPQVYAETPSYSYLDPVFGGTLTFSTDTPAGWTFQTDDEQSEILDSVVPPATPQASAGDFRQSTIAVSGDSLSSTDAKPATLTWDPYILLKNGGSGAQIPNPAISVSGSSQTFTPAVAFPRTESGAATLSGSGGFFEFLALDGDGPSFGGATGHSKASIASDTSGYDVSRVVSPAVVPAAGGTQTVTVSLTPRAQAGFASIEVPLDRLASGATVVPGSVTSPTTPTDVTVTSTDVTWSASVTVGTTYTLSFQVSVPPRASAITHKPVVLTNLEGGLGASTPLGVATSATYTDPVLGGDITWSSSQPVDWRRVVLPTNEVDLAGLMQTNVDHFRVQLGFSSVFAGQDEPVTVTALDASGNAVAGFTGPVTLTDLTGTLTVSTPLSWSGGVGRGAVRVAQASTGDTVTATAGGATGTNATPFRVIGSADHFTVTVGSSRAYAGAPLSVTATAFDSLNQQVTNFAGAPAVSDLTGTARVVSAFAWTGGVGRGAVTFSAGSTADRLTVSSGAANGTNVNPFVVIGPVDHFRVQLGISSTSAGAAFPVTVTALDNVGQVVDTYLGQPLLSDDTGTLSVVTPLSWAGGVGRGSVAVGAASNGDHVTATDGSATGTNITGFVVIGPVDHFRVSLSASQVIVPNALGVTVTAFDALDHSLTSYAGSPALSDETGTLSIVAPLTWSAGIGHASVTFGAGSLGDHVTATAGPAAGTNPNPFVVVGPPSRFRVQVSSSSVTVGSPPLGVTVTALDSVGQQVTTYAGPATLTDTTGTLSVVSPLSWTGGAGRGTVTFDAGSTADTITAIAGSVTGSNVNPFVVVGPADHFRVQVSTSTVQVGGAPLGVTVTALDSVGQVQPNYAGSPTFTDLTGSVTVVSALTWSSGVAHGTVTFAQPSTGDRLTATGGSLTGTNANPFVVIGRIDHFRVQVGSASVAHGAPQSATVTALDAANQTIPNYASSGVVLSDETGTLTVSSPLSWSGGVGRATVTIGTPTAADKVTATDPVSGATGTNVNAFRVT